MPNFRIPTEILLSVATVPLLLGIVGSRALVDLLQSLGQASEEVFRGDRLPLLDSASAPRSPDDEATS